MKVSIVKDTQLTRAVEESLKALPSWRCQQEVLKKLDDYKVYLYGGALRDILTNTIHNTMIAINDFDWLADDSPHPHTVPNLLKGTPGFTRNRFGNAKLIINGCAEMDIIPFSTIYLNLNDKAMPVDIPATIESIIAESDFSPNSAAYSINERVLYDYKAVRAIKSKDFELLSPKDFDYVTLAKIILQTDKLGFQIGPKAKAFIRKKYSAELDEDIEEYLEYKNKPEQYTRVVSRLREIRDKKE